MNVRDALAELVAVEDLKNNIEPAMRCTILGTLIHTEASESRRDEYHRRKPLALAAARAALAASVPVAPVAPVVPPGWKLLKDTTFDERSWKEDSGHENGNYICNCFNCGRTFLGHKRRVVCKVCAHPAAQSLPEQESRAMFVARLENMTETRLTIPAVLALLNDCDMLAARSAT